MPQQEEETSVSLSDLNTEKLFPIDWNRESDFGPTDILVESQGLFTLHLMSTVVGGEDMMYFDYPSGVFGRVTFIRRSPYGQWRNEGFKVPDRSDGRLDQLKAAASFVTQLDHMIQGQDRYGDVMDVLHVHIDEIVRSALAVPGVHEDEVHENVATLSHIMPFDGVTT